MTTQDIMIDDWVKVKSTQKPIKVKEIKQSCIYTENNGYEYDEIESIPLTQEILKKNGWLDTDEPMVIFSGVGKWERKYKVFEYVHELQHALRFCKIEKSIEL